MKDERFRTYVATRKHECEVSNATGGMRKVTWTNTNKLLDIEGYEGIKPDDHARRELSGASVLPRRRPRYCGSSRFHFGGRSLH